MSNYIYPIKLLQFTSDAELTNYIESLPTDGKQHTAAKCSGNNSGSFGFAKIVLICAGILCILYIGHVLLGQRMASKKSDILKREV